MEEATDLVHLTRLLTPVRWAPVIAAIMMEATDARKLRELEGWYNPHRRHSSLGYRSPNNYERLALQRAA